MGDFGTLVAEPSRVLQVFGKFQIVNFLYPTQSYVLIVLVFFLFQFRDHRRNLSLQVMSNGHVCLVSVLGMKALLCTYVMAGISSKSHLNF